MKNGIAFLKDVEDRFVERTGADRKKSQAFIKYINNRLKEIMSEDTTHSILLSGLCTIDESCGYLSHRSIYSDEFKNKIEDLKAKMDNMKKYDKQNHLRVHSFMYRRRTRLTDKELEDFQNGKD